LIGLGVVVLGISIYMFLPLERPAVAAVASATSRVEPELEPEPPLLLCTPELPVQGTYTPMGAAGYASDGTHAEHHQQQNILKYAGSMGTSFPKNKPPNAASRGHYSSLAD